MLADQHSDPAFPTQKGHHEQPTMPKGNDGRWFVVMPFTKRVKEVGVDLFNPHGKPKDLE
jgi:hypothetical protein